MDAKYGFTIGRSTSEARHSWSSFRVSGGLILLYVAYLDEFGHIGPYVSQDHPKHKTHPAFGLGGVVLPYDQVRSFSTYFFKLKNRLLKYDLDKSGVHPAKWEKKGSALYTLHNIKTYQELRQATNRLLNHIKAVGGFVIYVGIEKDISNIDAHDPKRLYHSVLKEAIKRLDQETEQRNAKFMLILDQQEENVLRGEIVETASIAMFGTDARVNLIEPPVQVESHLYQTVQCADWLCGIFGRLTHYECEPDTKADFKAIHDYFHERIHKVSLRSSLKRAKKPASSEQLQKLVAKHAKPQS